MLPPGIANCLLLHFQSKHSVGCPEASTSPSLFFFFFPSRLTTHLLKCATTKTLPLHDSFDALISKNKIKPPPPSESTPLDPVPNSNLPLSTTQILIPVSAFSRLRLSKKDPPVYNHPGTGACPKNPTYPTYSPATSSHKGALVTHILSTPSCPHPISQQISTHVPPRSKC